MNIIVPMNSTRAIRDIFSNLKNPSELRSLLKMPKFVVFLSIFFVLVFCKFDNFCNLFLSSDIVVDS